MSPQHQESFPVADPGTHQIQKYIHDIEFLNYHFNHDKWAWFRMFDITEAHRFMDDFDVYDTDHWTITNTGAATEALTDLVNGVLLLTNATADDDLCEISLVAESWNLVTSYPLYAEIRFKVLEALQTEMFFGLIAGASYYAGVNDGVYFRKDDGDYDIDFCTEDGGTVTATDTTENLAAITWIRLGFHWDGDETVRWFVIRDSDRYILATGSHTTNICEDTELRLAFGVRNGQDQVASLMYIDYVKCVQKRVIET